MIAVLLWLAWVLQTLAVARALTAFSKGHDRRVRVLHVDLGRWYTPLIHRAMMAPSQWLDHSSDGVRAEFPGATGLAP